MRKNIPFVDLITPHVQLKDQLSLVFAESLERASFIGGPMVEEFERDFARYCGAEHCVGVSSGTDALRFAAIAAGIKSGEIVVTVANTFIATVEAISQSGGYPKFVDVDKNTCNMDTEKLREYLESCAIDGDMGRPIDRATGRVVAAVIPVHLFGQPADMDPIMELAQRYNLFVIEDACQAHGAEYFSSAERQWRKAGSMGLAGAFSFYPGKNLGACGEGGAVVTNSSEIARTIRILRDHGQSSKYFHEIEGYNGRLDAIQAGILLTKLRLLPEWTAQRRSCASAYDEMLAGLEGIEAVREVGDRARGVYHLYVVKTPQREALAKHLNDAGIATGIHYPHPIHLQNAYRSLGYQPGSLPVTEALASQILSLPMFPHLSHEDQIRIVSAIRDFVRAADNLVGARPLVFAAAAAGDKAVSRPRA